MEVCQIAPEYPADGFGTAVVLMQIGAVLAADVASLVLVKPSWIDPSGYEEVGENLHLSVIAWVA